MRKLPTAIQSAYLDLIARHQAQRINALGGEPRLFTVGGRSFWYAQLSIAGRKTNRYIGPDTEAVRARIEEARAAVEDARTLREGNRALVRQLTAAGLPRIDATTGPVLRAMAQAGVFRLGGTLIGTQAFRLYGAELGVSLDGAFAATRDVDVAQFERLSLAVDDITDPALPDALGRLGLSPAPSLDPARPTRWRSRGGDLEVDFLAPAMTSETGPVRLAAFGLWAERLRFLNYLLREPMPAVALYLDGVLVQVPTPSRFAVHKLIVAADRGAHAAVKARKDFEQAKALIAVLAEDRPEELADAYAEARGEGPRWREALDRSLSRQPDTAALLKDIPN